MEMFDLANLDPKEYKMGEVNPRPERPASSTWSGPFRGDGGRGRGDRLCPVEQAGHETGGSDYKDEHGYMPDTPRLNSTERLMCWTPSGPLGSPRHIGFREIVGRLTVDRIVRAMTLLHPHHEAGRNRETTDWGGGAQFPHGRRRPFGPEEEKIIKPAVEKARAEGMDVVGPYPGRPSLYAPAGVSFPVS